MTRGVETQRISLCELRRSCVELTGKTGAREDAVELGNRFGGGTQRDEKRLQAHGQLAQDARDFSGFVFGKLHELVVGLDGFEGLEEERLARRAGAMHNTGNRPPVFRAHRNDEAVFAQRDVVFSRFGAACAENLLERFLDGFAGARDARADAAQSGGGLIADFTVRQDRAANRRKRLAEIHKRHGAGGKQRKLGRFFAKLLFEPARYF